MGCFQSKTQKESEMEDAQRAKMAAEVLPLCKSSMVEVPGSNLELHYCSLSLEGLDSEKTNQDSFCIHPQVGGDPNDHFFGVFDGHGRFGGECSRFVKDNFCTNLVGVQDFRTDIIRAYHAAFEITNEQLHADPNIDDFMSGTTAIAVVVRGDTLYVANVGDSRAILAERRGKDLMGIDLSKDQTPYRKDESARVKKHGGIIKTTGQLNGEKDPNVMCWGGSDDDGSDPPRVWVWDPTVGECFVGSAFTRSVGDKYVEIYGGVIADPEVNIVQLKNINPFFVIVSDGVTQFLSSQVIVDIVAKYEDLRLACSAIIARSYCSWLLNEGYSDDITIIIVKIKGLNDAPKGKPSSHSKGILNWHEVYMPTKVASFQ